MKRLRYGVSITDTRLGWNDTEAGEDFKLGSARSALPELLPMTYKPESKVHLWISACFHDLPENRRGNPDFLWNYHDCYCGFPDFLSNFSGFPSQLPDSSSDFSDFPSANPDFSSSFPDFFWRIPDFPRRNPDILSAKPDSR